MDPVRMLSSPTPRDEPSKLVRTASDVSDKRRHAPVTPSWRRARHNAAHLRNGVGASDVKSPQPHRPLGVRGMRRSTSTPNAAALVQSVKMATASSTQSAAGPPRASPTPGGQQQPPASPPRAHGVRPGGVSDLAPLLRQLSDAQGSPNSPVSKLGVTEEVLVAHRARLHGRTRLVASPPLPPRPLGGVSGRATPSALDREAARIATMLEAGQAMSPGLRRPGRSGRDGEGPAGVSDSTGAGAGEGTGLVSDSGSGSGQAGRGGGGDGTSRSHHRRQAGRGGGAQRGSGDLQSGTKHAADGGLRTSRGTTRRLPPERRRSGDRRMGQPAAVCTRPHQRKRPLQQPPQRQGARGLRGV